MMSYIMGSACCKCDASSYRYFFSVESFQIRSFLRTFCWLSLAEDETILRWAAVRHCPSLCLPVDLLDTVEAAATGTDAETDGPAARRQARIGVRVRIEDILEPKPGTCSHLRSTTATTKLPAETGKKIKNYLPIGIPSGTSLSRRQRERLIQRPRWGLWDSEYSMTR